MGRKLALIIASYAYQDEGLRRLTSPAHDAEALAEVLRDPDIAGFEVTILVNEPHHRIGEAVGTFFREPRHDDLTLLYFTGHGLKDDEGGLHLAAADTRRDNLLFTALSAGRIDQAMTTCMSRRQVLILDCCYSGAFPAARLTPRATTACRPWRSSRGAAVRCSPPPTPPSTPSRATNSAAAPRSPSSPAIWCTACARAPPTSTATATSPSTSCTTTSTTGSSTRCRSNGPRSRRTSRAASSSPGTSTGPCPHNCGTPCAARSRRYGSAP
ncbi:caspase family protein [Streptomyces prunicolor]